MATVTLRPAAGVLGDQNPDTYQQADGPEPGLPEVGALVITSPTLADSADLGTITSVQFAVQARVVDSESHTLNDRLLWQCDGEPVDEIVTLSRAPLTETIGAVWTLDPPGAPWTWAKVNGLTYVGASVDFDLPGSQVTVPLLQVAEVYATVTYTPTPAPGGGTKVHLWS